jgi:hypothetical protein
MQIKAEGGAQQDPDGGDQAQQQQNEAPKKSVFAQQYQVAPANPAQPNSSVVPVAADQLN